MGILKIFVLIVAAMLIATAVFAAHHTSEDRGKALFNDTKLGGGTAERSCSTCHPDGKGLLGIGTKKMWKTPGGEFKTLEETVNICNYSGLFSLNTPSLFAGLATLFVI